MLSVVMSDAIMLSVTNKLIMLIIVLPFKLIMLGDDILSVVMLNDVASLMAAKYSLLLKPASTWRPML